MPLSRERRVQSFRGRLRSTAPLGGCERHVSPLFVEGHHPKTNPMCSLHLATVDLKMR